jgi:hypothetical protein
LFRFIPIYDAPSIPIGTNIVTIHSPVTSVLYDTEIPHRRPEIKQEKSHE